MTNSHISQPGSEQRETASGCQPNSWGRILKLICAGAISLQSIVAFAQDSPNRQIVVSTNSGREFAGNLVSLDAGQLTVAAPESNKLPTKNLIHLKFKNRHLLRNAADPVVLLADGGSLTARAIGSDDETLSVRWERYPVWTPLRLPLETVRGLIFSPSDEPGADALLWNRIADHRDRHDLVLLNNGDTLIGQFAGLDEKTLTLVTTAGKSSIDRTGLRGVAFNPELTNVEPLKGEGALVSLLDGSRFRVQGLKLGTLDRLECRTLFGARLDLPMLTIDSLRFLGGCATYLSDLEPAQYRFEPFFDFGWPLRRDRNVRGGPLQLRGTLYPKGLGLHSQSEVSYRLDGRYRRFLATIGIDDDTLGKGNVVFEVLLDGRTVYKSDNLTGASPALFLDKVDVTGTKLLTLRVAFGAHADIQDHADWCDALLVK
jgi:NPCBM/NEW2 domain